MSFCPAILTPFEYMVFRLCFMRCAPSGSHSGRISTNDTRHSTMTAIKHGISGIGDDSAMSSQFAGHGSIRHYSYPLTLLESFSACPSSRVIRYSRAKEILRKVPTLRAGPCPAREKAGRARDQGTLRPGTGTPRLSPTRRTSLT